MKTLICKSLALLSLVAFIGACGSKSEKPCKASWEFSTGNVHDTINKTDCEGLKQGKWIPSKTNDLKDTVYYKDDRTLSM